MKNSEKLSVLFMYRGRMSPGEKRIRVYGIDSIEPIFATDCREEFHIWLDLNCLRLGKTFDEKYRLRNFKWKFRYFGFKIVGKPYKLLRKTAKS